MSGTVAALFGLTITIVYIILSTNNILAQVTNYQHAANRNYAAPVSALTAAGSAPAAYNTTNTTTPINVNPNSINPNSINSNPNNPNSINPIPNNPNSINSNSNNPNSINPIPINPNSINSNPNNPNSINPIPNNPNSINSNPINPNSINPNPNNPNLINPNSVFPSPVNPRAANQMYSNSNQLSPVSEPPLSLEQARIISAQKLYNARRAVASRDFAFAERLAAEVQKLNLQYQPTDDRPEAIIALIKQNNLLAEFAKTNGVNSDQYKRNYAMFLLSQANSLLNYGDVELAESLNNSVIAQNVLYNESDNRNGFTPQAVAKRINDIKNYRTAMATHALHNQPVSNPPNNINSQLSITAQRQLNDAILIMKDARKAILNGDIDRARNLCTYVQNMQLPDSLFPPNVDSPTKLLGEIAVRTQSVHQETPQANYPPTPLNTLNPSTPLNPLTPLNTASNRNEPTNNVTNNLTNNHTNNVTNNVTNNLRNTNNGNVPNNTNGINNVNAAVSYPNNTNPAMSNAVYNTDNDTTHNRHATSLPDTSDFVEQAKQARVLAMQQLSSEIIKMVSESKRLTNENRHDEAIEVLNRAKQRIDNAQIDETQKNTFYRSIDESVQTTNKHIEQNKAKLELDTRNQEVWNRLKNESEAARSREEQLKTYIDECTRLNDAQEYDQAILIAKKAREFAPNESVVHLLLQHSQMLANLRRSEKSREQKAETFLHAMHNVDSTAIIDPNVFSRDIAYSTTWSDIKKRRQSTSELLYDRPETERQIIRKLETPISFSTDRPIAFREFIDLLRAQTGLNIDVDWRALEQEAFITTDSPVSLKLSSEIKLKNVLNQILGQRGLAYVVKNEMLNITSSRQARGQLVKRYYYIGDLIRPIKDFDGTSPHDMNNIIDRSIKEQFRYQNNPNYKWNPAVPISNNDIPTFNHLSNNQAFTPDTILAQTFSTGTQDRTGGGTAFTNTNDPNNLNGAAGGGGADYDMIIDLIKNVTAWKTVDSEDANITAYEPSMSIVVRQTEEIHTEIVELLAQLRKLSDLQIAVEVRYITISDDYYEKMGVDFQMKFRNDGAADKVVLYGDNSSSTTTSTTDSDTDSSSSSSQTGIAKGNNVTVGLQGPSQFQFDLSIPVVQNTYGLADPMYGGFNPDSGLRMGFALLSDIEAYFFMNATQGDSRSNILQAPKVMIFNGQMGSVVDTTTSPFVTSVVPVVGDFAIGYQPIIAVLNEGQIMNVRGTVSPNRQYVRLTLEPRFTTITKVATFRYVGDENSTDSTTTSNGAEASSSSTSSADERRGTTVTTSKASSGVTIQQPIMASFSVQTTVSVPDGGTILMGGIKRLREGRIEAGTPILDKIPFIQRLFMNTAIGRDTSSILMVVTPRIIIQEEEEEFLTGIRP
jgi:general secretion pathway protein D